MTMNTRVDAPIRTARTSRERMDPPGMRAGKTWVEKTLFDLTRGVRAHMWWWEDPDRGPGGVLHVLGDGSEPVRREFSASLLRDSVQKESARQEIRFGLEAMVAEVTGARDA